MMRSALGVALLSFGGFASAVAQFLTPVVDGVISNNEYGIHSNGANQQQSSSSIWWMTWDAENLYLGVSGPAASDGVVIYLDTNPIAPINGGTENDGALTGQLYDNTNFSPLPFRSDYTLYFKNGYRELRVAQGGGWSVPMTAFGSYAGGSTIRELSVPWSSIGGRPAAFAWFGYATTQAGNVYGQIPAENANGGIGTAARFERYYTVSNTTNGSATWPFSRNSFVFNRTADWIDAGYLNVFDFTMNAPGRAILRTATNDPWIVSGTLHVEAGTVSFANSYGNTIVDNDVIIGQSGSLLLSTNAGDLTIKRHLKRAGEFTMHGRRVIFSSNLNQSITGSVAFDDLSLSKTGGVVTLSEDARVNGTLALVGGCLKLTNGSSLTIASAGNITGANAGSYIKTVGTGWMKREGVGTAGSSFPIGTDSSYNPVVISNSGVPDGFWARVQPTFDVAPNDPQRVVRRQWSIGETVPGGSNATLTLQWNAAEQGVLFNSTSPVFLLQHNAGVWNSQPASVSGSGPFSAAAGGFSAFNNFVIGNAGATSVEDIAESATGFALLQNYPNPFNPTTQIRFSVAKTGHTTLEIFNLLGEQVATLFDGMAEAGSYHSVSFEPHGLASGTYFSKLSSSGMISTRKLVLMK